MKPLTIQGIALVLMLLALPLTSLGTTSDATWASVLGLGLLAVGGLIPPIRRFAASDDDAQEESS